MPLPVNVGSLVQELRVTLSEIEQQIDAVKRDVLAQLPVHITPSGNEAYRYKDQNGNFLLTPLLAAKAQCLASISQLQTSR